MIGTDDGFWYAFREGGGGLLVDYEFFQFNERLQDGICDVDEMHRRFDAMCEASRSNEQKTARDK